MSNRPVDCSSIDFSSISSPNPVYYLEIYGILVALVAISSFLSVGTIAAICLNAGRQIHQTMFQCVIDSPIRFFDTVSSGRILNRFSKDTGNMDDTVPFTFYLFISKFFICLGAIIYSAIIVPWILIPLAPLIVVIYFVRQYFCRVYREMKRLDGTMKSLVIALIKATLDGLVVVRAYRQQTRFLSTFHELQDNHAASQLLERALER